jgi:hypothetical protein
MKIFIKHLALTLLISTLFSTVAFAQSLNKSFIGFWKADQSSVKTVFFNDKNDSIQMVTWDSSDGEEMEILELEIVGATIKTTERMPSTDWTIYNTYSVIDENTLQCILSRNDNETIIYLNRLK